MEDPSDPIAPDPETADLETLRSALAAERAHAREVEHRAKNSLQMIVSLLQLLARRNPHEETRAALKMLQLHVGAVAAVHRGFMQVEPGRPDRFAFTRFIREQAPGLAQAVGQNATLQLKLDEVEVEARHATPLALILSELTLNALKHGRLEGRPPAATIELHRTPQGLALTVQDGGAGPAAAAAPGFGLTMVRLLVQQIGGALTVEDAQPGLRAVVTAP
jgi:two-component sensor histidine kinase